MIYKNPCAPKVSKYQNLYALIGLRCGSLRVKQTSDVAKAIAGVLDETQLPSDQLVLLRNPSWAEKSGLLI